MNNRYTYKAKRKDNQEWVYGNVIINPNSTDKTIIVESGVTSYSSTKEAILEFINDYVEIIPETLCACTGLQDKDGNYIFENDIILFDETWEYLVFFKDTKWQILRLGNNATRDLYYFRNRANTMFKIIGNKFDKEVE